MLQAIKQQAFVNEQGRLEIISPELPKGKMVEVVIFIDQEQIDTTDYLLSTVANEAYLNKALQDIENKDNYIYPDEQLGEVAKSENPIKRLLASDLIGCAEGEANLSQNYKAELSKSLNAKYDYR